MQDVSLLNRVYFKQPFTYAVIAALVKLVSHFLISSKFHSASLYSYDG